MQRSFGTRQMTKPEGMLRELHWPSMARMGQRTGDGRLLVEAGGGVRELPQTVAESHADDAQPIGRVDQVIFHDDGNIEGWGWLLDSDLGRQHAIWIATQSQYRNSLELADVKAEIDFDEDWNLLIDFVEWNMAATASVRRPAFADAKVELTDELTAAIFADESPLEVSGDTDFDLFCFVELPEIVASASTTVPWDDFHIPESEEPHKIIVDAQGRVYGHLATWDSPHRGVGSFCPRPADDYAHYRHPGVLTDRGMVGTGPIFAVGGHPKESMRGKSKGDVWSAYGDIDNAWADVRVTAGRHGPWVSGRVRPGVDDDTLYAVRASHISGHWIGDELLAIVSCNAPGFKPGAGFAAVEDGRVVELVASFYDPSPPATNFTIKPQTFTWDGSLTFTPSAFQTASGVVSTPQVKEAEEVEGNEVELAAKRLKLLAEADDD